LSKGSHRRREDVKKVRDNWDAIFGRKDEKKSEPPKQTTKNEKTK
jgi:hypothetical protein